MYIIVHHCKSSHWLVHHCKSALSSYLLYFDPLWSILRLRHQMSFSRVYSGLHWSLSLQAQEEELQRWKAELTKVEGSCLRWWSSWSVCWRPDVRTVHREPEKPFAKPCERRDEMCAESAVVQKWVQNSESHAKLRGLPVLTPTQVWRIVCFLESQICLIYRVCCINSFLRIVIRRWVAHNLTLHMLHFRSVLFLAYLSLCHRSASENWCGSGMYLSSQCPVLDTLHFHQFSWEVHEKELELLVLEHFEVWIFWQTG